MGDQRVDRSSIEVLLDEGDNALRALTFMRGLFAKGITPQSTLTFKEEESRQAFQSGNVVFEARKKPGEDFGDAQAQRPAPRRCGSRSATRARPDEGAE